MRVERTMAMRILYLHQYFVAPGMAGGTRSYEHATRLAKAGHQVEILTSRQDSVAPVMGWSTEEMNGFRVHWFPVPYSNAMGYWSRLQAYGRFAIAASHRALQLGGDLVFASSTPLTIAVPGLIASKRLGIPMVLEVRDLWPRVPIAIGVLRNPILKWSARLLERIAYRGSAHVVALSPGMAAGVVQTGYPEAQITVVPNACDLELFSQPQRQCALFKELANTLGSRPIVLYCGTLGLVNGVSFLARVAKHALQIDPEIAFLVVGDGAERELVRSIASSCGVLDRNFFMRPPVPKIEVPALHARCTVATSTVIDVPELWDNSANKFFDALAAGLPVMINHCGWQAELLRQSGAGIVVSPHDPREAANELFSLLHDARRLAGARLAAKSLAIEQFDRERLADKLIAVLESVAAGHQSRPQVNV
jgi:glycosyltransferase involved in cell wall biosynthesis